jgi:hypothetical protein
MLAEEWNDKKINLEEIFSPIQFFDVTLPLNYKN